MMENISTNGIEVSIGFIFKMLANATLASKEWEILPVIDAIFFKTTIVPIIPVMKLIFMKNNSM